MLLPVYIPTLIISLAQGMLVPIMPLYARSFDISYWWVGVVLASQGIGNLVGDVPSGMLMQRLGQKWCMIGGIGLLALSMLAMSWAQTVPELIIYGFLAGLGNALWNISRHAYITTATALQQRGRAVATFGGLSRVGAFLGPLAGGAIAGAYGLRLPFVVFAAVALLALISSALFINDAQPVVAVRRGGLRGHSAHMLAMLRAHLRIFLTAGTGQLLAQMVRSGRTVIVPLFASDVIGLDVEAIGLLTSLSSAIDMAMFYPAGIIMDRFGRKYAYVPSFAIMGIGMALIPFTYSFGTMLVATLVVGFGNGLGSGTMLTLGSDLAPKENIGEFLGLWRLIGDAGTTGAPFVTGAIADILGLAPAAFVIGCVGLAAAAILGLFVPETLHEHSAVSPASAD
jgi:MFS family permease